ncbi:MAG: tetratricopeptide (TPR) repeat protein [Neolewinella sp.]|jgi:tetratricopeptide (TPR) repeat protein
MNKTISFSATSLSALLFTSLFMLAGYANGQDSLFAFVTHRGATSLVPAAAPVTNYKFSVANEVFTNLIRARGDRHKAIPRFVMNNGRQYMAWMNPQAVEIGMEERIYDVCIGFGPDSLAALAAVLAHEMTHYYENHDWSRSFVSQNEQLSISEEIASLSEGIKLETQADYMGGMLAIAAGYDVYDLMPRFLERAYAAYGLPESIPGYPSLADRIEVSTNTAEELKSVHAIYHTAGLLTMVGAYKPALQYYEHALNAFQSYEVYNNAGVCALLTLLDYMKPGEFPYALPLELDATSRLDKLATRLPSNEEAARAALLQKARNYLVNATNLTEREAVAALNMSIYHLLNEEPFDAEYWSTKAQRTAIRYRQPQTSGNAQIVQGILAAQDGRPDDAERLFTAALPKSRAIAELNLALVLGNRPVATTTTAGRSASETETIQGTKLEDILANLTDLEVNVKVDKSVFCGKKEYEDHTLFLHFADDGERYAAFQITKSNYRGLTATGAGIGTTRTEIMDQYGIADKVIATRTETCLNYARQGVIFCFDADDQLVRWIVYATKLIN